MKVAAMCGSFRSGSFNQGLLNAAIAQSPTELSIAQVGITEFPFYSQDIQSAGVPEPVLAAKRAIQASDCVLLVSPEYDYGVPGILKNAVEWLSRPVGDPTLVGRPMAVMGASGGYMGTMRAQMAWRQMWHYFKAPAFADVEMTVAFASKAFDGDGRLVDENYRHQLDLYLTGLEAWLRSLCRG